MKKTITLHVEGKGERIFFSNFIQTHFDYTFSYVGNKKINMEYQDDNIKIRLQPYDISDDSNEDLGGISSYKIRNTVKYLKSIQELPQMYNIFIIDADSANHTKPQGSYKKRREYLENLRKEFDVKFDFFIIPNDKDDGNLENLLDKIISEEGKDFYNCLKSYTNCLSKISKEKLPIKLKKKKDLNKLRFEWYTYMSVQNNTESGANRDYSLGHLWNLSSPSLNPLLEFLKSHLTIP